MTKTLQKRLIKSLFMGQTEDNFWFPVAKMTWDYEEGEYRNCKIFYLKGAAKLEELYPKRPYVVSLGSLERVYKSKNIETCLWRGRLPVNRPVDPEMYTELGLSGEPPYDPVKYASRSGGYRKGDSKDLFPEVLPDERGNYNFIFRPVNSWQFTTPNKPELETIKVGEEVNLIFIDEEIKLQCRQKVIGTAPGYISDLIKKHGEAVKLSIAVVNPTFPYEYQTLCKASLNEKEGIPFTEEIYQQINDG